MNNTQFQLLLKILGLIARLIWFAIPSIFYRVTLPIHNEIVNSINKYNKDLEDKVKEESERPNVATLAQHLQDSFIICEHGHGPNSVRASLGDIAAIINQHID